MDEFMPKYLPERLGFDLLAEPPGQQDHRPEQPTQRRPLRRIGKAQPRELRPQPQPGRGLGQHCLQGLRCLVRIPNLPGHLPAPHQHPDCPGTATDDPNQQKPAGQLELRVCGHRGLQSDRPDNVRNLRDHGR